MKGPHDEIRILGKPWSLVGVESLTDDDGAPLFGLCETWEQRIRFSTDTAAMRYGRGYGNDYGGYGNGLSTPSVRERK